MIVQRETFAGNGEDSHGNEVESWGEPVDVEIMAFDPGSTSEPREAGHDRVIVEPTIYLYPGTIFGPRDRVIVNDRTYEVEGETRVWEHPEGADHYGNVITIRRVEG